MVLSLRPSQSTLLVLLLSSVSNILTSVNAQQASNPYYLIEPFTFPSVIDENGTAIATFRNNVCDLAERRDELDLATILQGISLHSILMDNEFVNFDYDYEYIDGKIKVTNLTLNEEYPGLIPLLADEVCRRAGCTWRNTFVAYTYEVMTSRNKTFNELLDWSTAVYDVSLNWWMRNVDRLKRGIAFTEKWYDASIILVNVKEGKEKKVGFDPFSWLYPFDEEVWLLTVGTVFFSAFMYWLLEYLHSDESMDPIETTWMLATAVAGQFAFDPQTPAARLFTFSIAFWALLMGAAYTANLASFLVAQNTVENPIETIGQGVQAGIRMCIVKSSVTDTTVTNAFPAYSGSGFLVRLPSHKEAYLALRASKCEILITEVSSWETFRHDVDVNGDCKLQQIGRIYSFVPASFTFLSDAGNRCTSLIRAVFDLHLYDMEREGIIADLWQGHIDKTATMYCNKDEEEEARRRQRQRRLEDGNFRLLDETTDTSASDAEESSGDGALSLANMGGVFLLHFVLSFLAIVLGLISRYRNQKDDKLDKCDESNAETVSESALSPTKGSDPAVDALRAEMNAKLKGIEGKLEKIRQLQSTAGSRRHLGSKQSSTRTSSSVDVWVNSSLHSS